MILGLKTPQNSKSEALSISSCKHPDSPAMLGPTNHVASGDPRQLKGRNALTSEGATLRGAVKAGRHRTYE